VVAAAIRRGGKHDVVDGDRSRRSNPGRIIMTGAEYHYRKYDNEIL
jgi:hypothetical protein